MNLPDINELQSFADAVYQGRALTFTQATALEHQLADFDVDLLSRLKLIGYYNGPTEEALRNRMRHVMWFIEHRPSHDIWQEITIVSFGQSFPADVLEQAKDLWFKQIALEPRNLKIVGHAGMFLGQADRALACDFLTRAIGLDSTNELWYRELMHNRFLAAKDAPAPVRSELASIALDAAMRFLDVYGESGGREKSPLRENCLRLCIQSAYWARDFANAKTFADAHLKLVEKWSVLPKISRSILGLIALEESDVETAVTQLLYLQAASQPDLWDLQLANELIQHGESKCVLKYLKRCRELGLWNNRKLDDWISSVQSMRENVTLS